MLLAFNRKGNGMTTRRVDDCPWTYLPTHIGHTPARVGRALGTGSAPRQRANLSDRHKNHERPVLHLS